jgi:hypothetical protein
MNKQKKEIGVTGIVCTGIGSHPAAEVYGSMKAGFVGSNCFMKANDNLSTPINWI